MVKPAIYRIVFPLLAFLFAACSEEIEDVSALRLHLNRDFTITDIQEGPDGTLHCIGFRAFQDTVILLSFDRNRNLIRERELNGITGGYYQSKLLQMPDGSWFVASELTGAYNGLKLMKLDADLNKISEKEIYRNTSSRTYGVHVPDMMRTRNGEIIVAWDTVNYRDPETEERGFLISRFTPDLDEIWTFRGKPSGSDSSYWKPGFSRLVEMENGDLCFMTDVDIFLSTYLLIGRLTRNGELIYQQLHEPYSDFGVRNALSDCGDRLLVSSTENSDNIVLYSLFNAQNGNFEKRRQLHFLNDGTGNWAETNSTLPRNMSGFEGHFIYSKDRQSLFFQLVDPDLELQESFELKMPEFERLRGCKHLRRANGNIVSAVSYSKAQRTNFVLFETDREGNLN